MKKRIVLLGVSMMLGLLCGCLEATPLTDKEMDVVAEYAASLLLKYDNKYDTPLYYNDFVQEEEMTSPALPTKTPTPTPVSSTQTPGDSSSQQNPAVTPEATPTIAPVSDNSEETSRQLTEIIGVEDVTITCDGYKAMDSVFSTDYFSLQAKEGRKYIVVNFTLHNTTNQKIVFDASGRGLEYSIDVNTGTISRVSLSMLKNDLQYMPIEVPAKGTAEAVLAFEIAVTELETLHLIIKNKNDDVVFVKMR